MSNFPVPPAVPEPAAPPKGPNGFYLFARVFDEPAMVFTEITRLPRLLAPIIILCLIAALRPLVTPEAQLRQQVEIGFQAAESFGAQLSPDQKQQAIDNAVSTTARVRGAIFGGVGAIIGTAILALVLWGVFALAGAELTFGKEYSIVLYGCAPTLLGLVVVLALIPVTHSATFSMGLGFLVSADTSPFLHLFFAGITIFSVWTLWTLALGHQIVRKQKSIMGSLMILVVLWLLVSAGGAAMGAKFGAANLM